MGGGVKGGRGEESAASGILETGGVGETGRKVKKGCDFHRCGDSGKKGIEEV